MKYFDVVNAIRKSQLLFTSDDDFLQSLGCSDKTLKRNKDDSKYYEHILDILDKHCLELTECPIDYIYHLYKKASEVYINKDIWGTFWKTTSKKKFCLGLFCKKYLPDYGKIKGVKDMDSDAVKAVIENFITKDLDEKVDICFLLLLSYGIINPIDEKIDLTDQIYMLNMKELLEEFQENLPIVGVFKSNPAINYNCIKIDQMIANNDDMCVAEYWCTLSDIAYSLHVCSSPNAHADTHIVPVGYRMPGIWIDDKDKGETKFWIFPENRLMAFCFEQNKAIYKLKVYEFAFYQDEFEEDFVDRCMICTLKGNEEILFSYKSKASDDEKFIANCEFDVDNDQLNKITFTSVNGRYPYWMSWRSFEKLNLDCEMYKKYSKVATNFASNREILDSGNVNWLINSINSLIAIDEKYIYLSDTKELIPHKIKDRRNGRYTYEPAEDNLNARNLLDVKIDEQTPMYVMPRILDKKDKLSLLSKATEQSGSYCIIEKWKTLKEVLEQTELGDQITIYRKVNSPTIICFNRFSFVLPLDELIDASILKKYITKEGLFLNK
jgi:hypothetical protein